MPRRRIRTNQDRQTHHQEDAAELVLDSRLAQIAAHATSPAPDRWGSGCMAQGFAGHQGVTIALLHAVGRGVNDPSNISGRAAVKKGHQHTDN